MGNKERNLDTKKSKNIKELERETMKNTKVTVTVKFEVNYEDEVSENDIDINDIIRDVDSITDIKIKTKVFKVLVN
tara:strand:+ start:319 stop:546 length:228 start_codon:yes stop_codon:yes gene_type:complete